MENQPVTSEQMCQILKTQLLPTFERILQAIKERDHELLELRHRVGLLEGLAKWQALENRPLAH